MYNIVIVFIVVAIASCIPVKDQKSENIANESRISGTVKDTSITYSIDGISVEGTECKATYVNGIISSCITNVYGESGQATIEYKFEADRIQVKETKYSYKTRIENVRSEKDIQLDCERSYYIDFNGRVIGDSLQDRIDIYEKFKSAVPLEL